MKTGVLMIALCFLFGCQSDKNKDKAKNEPVYCYIQNMTSEQGNYFADIIYFNFLDGDEAIEAARKAGDAYEEIDEDGNIEYSVPNDYYIEVEDERIYKVKIADDAGFTSWAYSDEEGMYRMPHADIEGFLNFYSERNYGLDHVPFRIRTKNDVIIEIEEIYVP